jgi:hypothetical protein
MRTNVSPIVTSRVGVTVVAAVIAVPSTYACSPDTVET